VPEGQSCTLPSNHSTKYMTNFALNIKRVRQRLSNAAARADRVDAIALLAVSKGQPAASIRAVRQTGQRDFGENYLQEALDKMAQLQDLDLCWHFIGPVQSNKTRPLAEHFHWVQTVDRLKIAQRLSDQRPASLPPLNICIQVNIDGEDSKSGVAPDEVEDLARHILQLPRLQLRGLMAIPAPVSAADSLNMAANDTPFFHLAQLLATLRTRSPALAALDTLSMGMSGDLEAAVAAGSTLVRVGTAIFGERNRQQTS